MLPLSKRRFGRIKALQSKKERQTTGLTLLEGESLLVEALRDGIRLETVVGTAEFWTNRLDLVHRLVAAGITTAIASQRQMESLSLTEHSAGILAVIPKPVWQGQKIWQQVPPDPFLGCLAVGLQDPGNVGTLIRALAASGGSGAWLSAGTAEAYAPKTIRASAGAVLRLPVLEQADPWEVLKQCREAKIQTLAAVPKQGRSYTAFDFTLPTVIVLGEEGGGLAQTIIQNCQSMVSIPMSPGIESLNVAVAGAIIFFEAVRQRRLWSAQQRRIKA